MGLGVGGLGFRVQGSGFRVEGLGFRVWSRWRVQGVWFKVVRVDLATALDASDSEEEEAEAAGQP